MEEDKENTRPREKKVEINCDEPEKPEKLNKEKKEAMTKVVNVVSRLTLAGLQSCCELTYKQRS